MNAKISYEMHYQPHPWDEKARKAGIEAWVLYEVVTPEHGDRTIEPVAIFNLDSVARRFQAHVFTSGLDGKLITIDNEMRELFEIQAKRKREGRP